MSDDSYIRHDVIARRVLSPTTLAPYASAVSNLLVKLEIASGKVRPRNDDGIS
jgi:hypothetical protein